MKSAFYEVCLHCLVELKDQFTIDKVTKQAGGKKKGTGKCSWKVKCKRISGSSAH